MNPLNLYLAQIDTTVGDVDGNLSLFGDAAHTRLGIFGWLGRLIVRLISDCRLRCHASHDVVFWGHRRITARYTKL